MVVPRVAAPVTAQVMLPVNRPAPPASTTSTLEALAVVSELPTRNVHDASSLPPGVEQERAHQLRRRGEGIRTPGVSDGMDLRNPEHQSRD